MALPIPIDYTSRDYTSIRADLLTRARIAFPEWNTRDENDFGVVLVELFAGMGDMLNYYIDRAGNEAYLETAVQRSSLLALARLLGYTPTPLRSATASLTLNNTSGNPFTVAKGSRFYATNLVNGLPYNIYFETDVDVTVPVGSPGVAVVNITQGVTTLDEIVGTSDGTLAQTYVLFNPNVAVGSVQVEVNEVGTFVPWRVVEHVVDYSSTDPVCEVFEDANGLTYVKLGDGISGRIPSIGAPIRVTYRVCDGFLGNVADSSITHSASAFAGLTAITNGEAAVGGADRESDDSIRFNAPAALRALNRAVTTDDYAALALQVNGVGKAKAELSAPGSVTVYVAPTAAVAPGNALKDAVTAYLADKQMVGTVVAIADPTFVPIDVSATVFVQDNYRQDHARSAVSLAVQQGLAFNAVDFADTVVPADIISAIFSVGGVRTATVQVLDRSGYTGTGGVVLADNEIPTLGTLSLSMQGGIA